MKELSESEKKLKKGFISYGLWLFSLVILLILGCTNTTNTTVTIPKSEELSPGLVAYWSFDEQGGDNVKDLVDGFKGTVYGAEFMEGKKGNALYFDGVNDYVELSKESHDSICDLSRGTIAFWFKFESILDKQKIMPIFTLEWPMRKMKTIL